MYSFEAAASKEIWCTCPIIPHHDPAVAIASWTLALCQCVDALIGDVRAFDETYSPQLGKRGKFSHGQIREVNAASEINVSYPIAVLHEFDDCRICNVTTVPQMEIVQVFAEFADRIYSRIFQVYAFCEYKIPQSRGSINDLLNST